MKAFILIAAVLLFPFIGISQTYQGKKWGDITVHKSWAVALDNSKNETVSIKIHKGNFNVTLGKKKYNYTVKDIVDETSETNKTYLVEANGKTYRIKMMMVDGQYYAICKDNWVAGEMEMVEN
jgi:hypothetical protein